MTVTFGTVASAKAKRSFAPCLMMPPYSWSVPGKKPGTSTKRDERDVEAVAEADEARGLHRRVDVEHAREHLRLVGDDADRAPADAREADDDVRRELLG